MLALNLVLFVGILMVLVVIHEWGHLVVAKRAGMHVPRFMVFFGRPLVSVRRGETEYGIGWLPLGGYVKISGMVRGEEVPPEGRGREYYAAPVRKRVATILAGPAVNIVFALLVFVVAAWIGPRSVELVNRVASVSPDSPAERIGLGPGDELVAVNGVRVGPGGDITAVRDELRENPGERVSVTYARPGGGEVTRPVALDSAAEGDRRVGRLGFTFELERGPREGAGLLEGVSEGADQFRFVLVENGKALARAFSDEETRDDVQSIVGIGATFNEVSDDGLYIVLLFVGLVSMALGIFNLIPLLPLDGGHVLFALIEKLKGSPVSRSAYERTAVVGLALLLLVAVFVIQNDVIRIRDGTLLQP